jgi:5-methylcytosine-specific restriction endonuclease McrA
MTEEERKARKAEQKRLYREANPEKVLEQKRLYREANPEKVLEQKRLYRETNREQVREQQRRWCQANPEKVLEQKRLYRETNREQVRERQRLYREANPEKVLEQKRLYRETNREKVRERNRLYREANPEKVREWQRLYCEANPEKVRERDRHRRAIKARATFPGLPRTTSLAVALRRQLFNNSCAYCGGPGPFHDDHVEPLSRGGLDTPTNLVPACARCNLSKHAKPVESWYLSQPFFCPVRWAALKRHTDRKWSEVEQLTLLEQHP